MSEVVVKRSIDSFAQYRERLSAAGWSPFHADKGKVRDTGAGKPTHTDCILLHSKLTTLFIKSYSVRKHNGPVLKRTVIREQGGGHYTWWFRQGNDTYHFWKKMLQICMFLYKRSFHWTAGRLAGMPFLGRLFTPIGCYVFLKGYIILCLLYNAAVWSV